jgi:hypothetical protein
VCVEGMVDGMVGPSASRLNVSGWVRVKSVYSFSCRLLHIVAKLYIMCCSYMCDIRPWEMEHMGSSDG